MRYFVTVRVEKISADPTNLVSHVQSFLVCDSFKFNEIGNSVRVPIADFTLHSSGMLSRVWISSRFSVCTVIRKRSFLRLSRSDSGRICEARTFVWTSHFYRRWKNHCADACLCSATSLYDTAPGKLANI